MKLVLQRGHGGRTSGRVGTAGEQELVARIAARVVQLAPRGVQVSVIDADEPTHRYAGDAFLALHADGSSNPKVGGASVGYRNAAGRELAERWKACYAGRGWPFGFRTDNYTAALANYYGTGRAIIAGNQRAAILEHGFLTNPTERKWLESDRGITVAATATLEAVTGRRLIVPAPPTRNDAEPQEDDVASQLPIVKRGDRGAAVKRVQGLLIAAGVAPANTIRADGTVDGVYGGGTDAAVRRFQQRARIGVDGVVGPVTWSALLGLQARAA